MGYEFKPTDEQQLVIDGIEQSVMNYLSDFSEDPEGVNTVIQAPAGTGKSSNILFSLSNIANHHELDHPKQLYLVLNTVMRQSMSKIIEKKPSLMNVKVSTFHKFMLDHLAEHFPEVAERIDFKRSSINRSDIKEFLERLFKNSFKFNERETRIPHATLLETIEHYNRVFMTTDAINAIDMNEKLREDIKVSKHFNKLEEIETTENFLTPYANVLYDSIYTKNPERFNEILGVDSLEKEDMSRLDNFTKMIGHFFIKSILTPESELPITHDVYFKMAYISMIKNPQIDLFGEYTAIYVDEAQDLDPMTINILAKAKTTVSYFGDSNQQLYAFKGSVDSLSKVENSGKEVLKFALTESFRYRHDIAILASMFLSKFKNEVEIKGKQTRISESLNPKLITDENTLYERIEKFNDELNKIYKKSVGRRRHKIAVISRTNENVLKNTLTFLKYKEESGSRINASIEGEFKKKIKSAIKGQFPEGIAKRLGEAIGSRNLGDGVPIETFRENSKAVSILKNTEFSFLVDETLELNDLIRLSNERMGEVVSEVIFLSAHQSKGREYTHVVLDSDFMAGIKEGESIEDFQQRSYNKRGGIEHFDSEVNLGYVAITRVKNSLTFYKENNPLHSFFMESSKKIEEGLSPFDRTEYFDNGLEVKYGFKEEEGDSRSYYTKEVSDVFGDTSWYEISYIKPSDKEKLTISEDSNILKNTFIDESGSTHHEYKFLTEKSFKKEGDLTEEENRLVLETAFTEPSEIRYKDEKYQAKKNSKEQSLFDMAI